MLTNIVLVYGIKSCNFIYQHIEKHLILQKYDSFLDLLSKNIKTNRNKIVFFAAIFVRYEKIHIEYIYSDTDTDDCFSTRADRYSYQRHHSRTDQKGIAQTKGSP